MMFAVNTEMHTQSGVIAELFGDDGAIRLVPIKGDTPGEPFILDAQAADDLRRFLSERTGR